MKISKKKIGKLNPKTDLQEYNNDMSFLHHEERPGCRHLLATLWGRERTPFA